MEDSTEVGERLVNEKSLETEWPKEKTENAVVSSGFYTGGVSTWQCFSVLIRWGFS